MGFLQRAAERSERRVMLQVSGAIGQLTNLDQGTLDIPCHILEGEIHQAVWVGHRDQTEGAWVAVYRCQMAFWGVGLTKAERDMGIKGDPLFNYKIVGKRLAGGGPVNLGPMAQGVESLAFALTTLDYPNIEA